MKRRTLVPAALILFALAAVARPVEFTKGPYIQGLTATGVTVMWESSEVAEASVEWGPSGRLGRVITTRGRGELAQVRLERLKPDTGYFYRVTEGDAVSPIYAFRTLPVEGRFRFAVYGDTRSLPLDHAKVAARVAGAQPAFVLHVGDVVGDGTDAALWGPEFFDAVGPFIARFAVFTAPGNHEEESPLYYRYLGTNATKPWYSFDCVNAHFVILNSCLDLSPGSEQYEWLLSDLASTDKRWRFVTLHHPPYSSGAHGSSVGLREILEPLFHRYGVDIVFTGHDHHYERTFPIVSAFRKVRPVTYVVTGGGGAPRRPVSGDFYSANYRSALQFCTVDIDDNVLLFRALDENARPFDALRIVKLGETYANTYPQNAVPYELAAAEAAVQNAFATRRLDYPESDRSERFAFEYAAPEWSALELELEWTGPQGAMGAPAGKKVFTTEAGKTGVAVFDAAISEGDTRVPGLAVSGRTSLGEFRFEASPFRFRPQQTGP